MPIFYFSHKQKRIAVKWLFFICCSYLSVSDIYSTGHRLAVAGQLQRSRSGGYARYGACAVFIDLDACDALICYAPRIVRRNSERIVGPCQLHLVSDTCRKLRTLIVIIAYLQLRDLRRRCGCGSRRGGRRRDGRDLCRCRRQCRCFGIIRFCNYPVHLD